MRAVVVATTVLAVLSLAGCGEESSGDTDVRGTDDPTTVAPATTPASPVATEPPPPACANVWTAGAMLPADYYGCSDASGEHEQHVGTYCESGQSIYTFDDRLYATPGGVVVATTGALKDDPTYRRTVAGCTA